MKARIQAALEAIERREGVRVLYACESGSRAWGFESADSDWVKKYFYVLRPVLACRWIERGLGAVPMELPILVERLSSARPERAARKDSRPLDGTFVELLREINGPAL